MTAPVPAATDDQPLDSQEPVPPSDQDPVQDTVQDVAPDVAPDASQDAAAAAAAVADVPAPEAVAAPMPSLPDRADAPVSEVAERFLKAVIAEVPLELIEELHLFSPLRQGTVETGIAVLAARVPVVEAEPAAEPELPFAVENADTVDVVEAETVEAETVEATALAADAPTAEHDEAAADELEAESEDSHADDAPLGDAEIVVQDDAPAIVAATEAEAAGEEADEPDAVASEELDVVAAEGDDDEDVSVSADEVVEASADESDEAEAMSDNVASDEIVAPSAPAPRPVRHTVYTARYRYVIKGPERGKWESSIKAEADAPLITVETVVRGVQRRAGEESEIVRYTGAQIAKALRVPYPA